MTPNFLIIFLAALVPMAMGFIWYHPKVFGAAWMNAAGMTEDKIKGANMAKIFGLAFVLSFLLAFALQFVVIHQFGFYSILVNEPGFGDPNSDVGMMIRDFMGKYEHNFRTFKHGAFHGTLMGITVALPIVGIHALFERKSGKYIMINVGYLTVAMALMGGIICAFA
jgi:hypothetical protein